MDHHCLPCNYETNIKASLLVHLKSTKHIKNQSEATDALIKKLTLENQELRTANIMKDKEIECNIKEIEGMKANNQFLVDHINNIKSSANLAGNIATNAATTAATTATISTIKYIMDNYTPPAIETYKQIEYSTAMKNLDIINDDNSEETFIKDIIYHSSKNILSKYLGDIIVKLYKKNDSKEQSMWNSDVSRLSYIIREKIGDNFSWTTDKSGVLVNKYVIQPYLTYIYKLLTKTINAITKPKKLVDLTSNQIEQNNEISKGCILIKQTIDNKILEHDINKHIAPFFYFNQKDKPNLISEK